MSAHLVFILFYVYLRLKNHILDLVFIMEDFFFLFSFLSDENGEKWQPM